MQQGQINVQTENIFPIIKRFLYSDHEIFLREIVSNAVDACQKLEALNGIGEANVELGKLQVEVKVDKKAKTIQVIDNGLGMTAEEVEKYINQIAFSGAEEFLKKYEDKTDKGIIGHFGLGFYSSFMVSSKVEIDSLSFKEGAEAVKWTCDGSPNYEIGASDKTTRGTTITMFINEDSEEFLEESRALEILNKYCKFLPVSIKCGTTERTEKEKDAEGKVVEGGKETKIVEDRIVNTTDPLWMKQPSDLKSEDYQDFYRDLYPMSQEPLFNIHLNVDYPFNLTGVLYFPKFKDNFEIQRNKIQLYSNQVFITDSVADIVPEWLTLLHGVIDSPDIPLNVSRSYLQADGQVKKIAAHISKKVSDKLNEMFKNDRADFESKWEDIKLFIEYGMLSDEKFFDRIKKSALYKDTEGNFMTWEQLVEAIKPTQTNKDKTTVVLYASDLDEQHAYIKEAQDRGYKVIHLDGPLVSHLMSKLEQSEDKVQFARVDSDTIDKLIQKEEAAPSKLSDEEKEKIKPVFEGLVEKDKFMVQFEPMNENSMPIIVTQSEFMRRMREQQQAGGGAMFGSMPEMYNLVVNENHPLVGSMIQNPDSEESKAKVSQMIDLALLSQGMLKGEKLSQFLQRSVEILK